MKLKRAAQVNAGISRAPRGARELKLNPSANQRVERSRAPRGARELKLKLMITCLHAEVAPHAGRVN